MPQRHRKRGYTRGRGVKANKCAKLDAERSVRWLQTLAWYPQIWHMLGMDQPTHAELLREYLEQLSEVGPETRVLSWKDWVHCRLTGPFAVGAALAITACGGSESNSDGSNGGTAGTSASTVVTAGGQPGFRYAVPLGGSAANGGSSATHVGGTTATANGGSSATHVGGTTANTIASGGIAGTKYSAPQAGSSAGTSSVAAGGSTAGAAGSDPATAGSGGTASTIASAGSSLTASTIASSGGFGVRYAIVLTGGSGGTENSGS